MRRAGALWAAFWLGFGLLDWLVDRRGYSLCTTVRHWARLDTRPGREAFAIGYLFGAGVLLRHLMKRGHPLD